jgi:colanic acid/amylovoran biosynthesis glycosyltransferase
MAPRARGDAVSMDAQERGGVPAVTGPSGSVADDKPVVAVWRSLWLPGSETFVHDHLASLQRYEPLTLGLYQDAPDFQLIPDRAPFARTGYRARLAAVSSRLGHVGVYESILRRRRPSLVHAHFGTGAVEALPVARRNRLPLVVTFHGHDVNRAPLEDASGRYRRRLAEVFDYASVLLAVSEFIAGRLLDLGAPADKVRVHHLGIPLRPPLPDPAADRAGVTFVGRLTRQKGVEDLLLALADLPADLLARTPVRIVGDGPERQRLETLARSLPVSEIAFLGRLAPEQVASLLATTALFVGPSTTVPEGDAEAFGLAALEASRAGVPVVSYDYAGMPEAVVDGVTGLLAPVADVHGLAERMQALLTDRGRAVALGAAGQRRVVADFDVLDRTRALEEIYDEVCRSARRPGRHRRARGA